MVPGAISTDSHTLTVGGMSPQFGALIYGDCVVAHRVGLGVNRLCERTSRVWLLVCGPEELRESSNVSQREKGAARRSYRYSSVIHGSSSRSHSISHIWTRRARGHFLLAF